ncbi:expressed unknown protein [Seminavis robusta]|uniref:Uncharacterized protein n=1 Tax=Seminavis robusta TaxID=568900 RepID=A0A9N8DV86_9STRA|nr:expressed unknown protein [Seminavis robusta]|eukprot:Sro387_g132000.1 n/a (97) ;mRNA; r:4738-5028
MCTTNNGKSDSVRETSPKRTRPRLQSGNSVRGLDRENSSRALGAFAIENRDPDDRFVRQQSKRGLSGGQDQQSSDSEEDTGSALDNQILKAVNKSG